MCGQEIQYDEAHHFDGNGLTCYECIDEKKGNKTPSKLDNLRELKRLALLKVDVIDDLISEMESTENAE